MLKNQQEIENVSLENESSDHKRKKAGVTGPLLRCKAEELAYKMGKNYFLHIMYISFYSLAFHLIDSFD